MTGCKNRMKSLPNKDQPYEKCERYGTGYLSDTELLAVILRTGSKTENAIELARKILKGNGTDEGLVSLNYLSLQDLMSFKGIGKVKAIQIVCITELTKRMAKATKKTGIRLTNPNLVAEYYMQDLRHLTVEQVILIMLDSKSKVLKDLVISTGTVNSSILAPREVFLNALKYGAVNIILVHNHPSGDPSPSKEDILSTKRLKEAGSLIGIQLMDHVIIGDNRYVSMKETSLL